MAQILTLDDLRKFPDSGMRVREAIRRARKWYDDTAREIITKQLFNEMPKSRRTDPNDGIMAGLPFDQLNGREQFKIVMVWHRQYCIDNRLGRYADRK